MCCSSFYLFVCFAPNTALCFFLCLMSEASVDALVVLYYGEFFQYLLCVSLFFFCFLFFFFGKVLVVRWMRRVACIQGHIAPEVALSCGTKISNADKGDFEETRLSEKKRCEWSVDELEYIIDRDGIELKRQAFKTILEDPVFEATDLDQFEKSTFERREQSTRRLLRFAELVKVRTIGCLNDCICCSS
jgi:hypothetical protein